MIRSRSLPDALGALQSEENLDREEPVLARLVRSFIRSRVEEISAWS